MPNPLSTLELARQRAEQGRTDEAIGLLMRHLRQSPRDVAACMALGVMLYRAGRIDQSEFYFAKAVEIAPTNPAARSDHANALVGLGRIPEAIAQFRESLRLNPNQWLASSGLAQALIHSEDYEEAIRIAEDGLARSPAVPNLHDDLARALLLAGRADDAVASARRGIQIAPQNQRLRASLAVALTYSPAAKPEEVTEAYAINGKFLCARTPPPPRWANSKDPDRRIRLGLLSSDFREHSVAYFLEPLLANLDPQHFHTSCYVLNANSDEVTRRFRAHIESRGGSWVEVAGQATQAIADRIRRDTTDILVELGGHSFGHRLGVVIALAAPLQVDYLGWATTTGIPTVTHRIVDSITDPPGADRLSTERLIRIDPCFICFRPPDNAPEPAAPHADDPPTFGSFNALAKINPACIGAWAKVMTTVPHSRMIIKAQGLESASQRARILASFEESSITPDRIELLARIPDLASHRALYSRIHIALDTFPYNGTTTTCEALWMGVPVLTIAGAMHAGRVGASVLSAIGAPDWIARDEAHLASLAAALMADRAQLSALRHSLRDRLRTSILCDAPAFARRFENGLRIIWRDWCSAPTA